MKNRQVFRSLIFNVLFFVIPIIPWLLYTVKVLPILLLTFLSILIFQFRVNVVSENKWKNFTLEKCFPFTVLFNTKRNPIPESSAHVELTYRLSPVYAVSTRTHHADVYPWKFIKNCRYLSPFIISGIMSEIHFQ